MSVWTFPALTSVVALASLLAAIWLHSQEWGMTGALFCFVTLFSVVVASALR